jgi:hypothetical protein
MNKNHSYDFLVLSLSLLPLLVIALLLPVTPQDYWWYLRVGQDTLTARAIPTIDTLSYTQAGQPVVYHSWGAALLFLLIYRLGGLPITILLRGIVIGVTYSLAWYTAYLAGARRLGTGVAMFLAGLASSNNWALRPQLLVYPLFALALWILYQWQAGKNKFIWWLPMLGLIWVNLHGSFVILILLVGTALVFGVGNRRALGVALLGIFLATLINPRGFGAWMYVFSSLASTSNQQFSAEWYPPVNAGWQMHIFFLGLLGFPLLVFLSPRKFSRLEWAWFISFGALALWGLRYIIWFVLILMILIALLIANWEQKWFRDVQTKFPGLNVGLGLAIILLPLVFMPSLREHFWKESPSLTANTPVAAAEWLAGHPEIPGPLWSEIGFSSYLEYVLPSRPVAIDTRFEVYPVAQWRNYQDISSAAWNWNILLDAVHARLIMVSVQGQPRLLEALRQSQDWCEIYHDQETVIYSKGKCGEK